jgi:hypothetical protein
VLLQSPYTQALFSFGLRSKREPSIRTSSTEDHKSSYGDVALPSSKSQTFQDSEYGGGSGDSIHSAEWIVTASRGLRTKAVDIDVYRNGPGQGSKTVTHPLSEVSTERDVFGEGQNFDNNAAIEIPWPTNTNVVRAQREAFIGNGLTRIKSVGTAPIKTTPLPTRLESGVSISLERMEFETLMGRVEEDARQNSNTSGKAI